MPFSQENATAFLLRIQIIPLVLVVREVQVYPDETQRKGDEACMSQVSDLESIYGSM